MSWNDFELTFLAGAALEPKRRVKFKSGTTTQPPEVEYAGAGEAGIGITQIRAAQGDPVSVAIWNNGATHEVEAGGQISLTALVYGAANGKVSATPDGPALGYANIGASGDGSIIELMPDPYAGDVSVAELPAGSVINGSPAKNIPVDADMTALMDSADSNALKKLSWANIKATLKTYFDGLYQAFLAQRSGASQAAVATTGSTNTTPYGFATAAQADAIPVQLAEVRATLMAMGVWKGSA